jgi:hypothetical protein
MEEGWGLPSTVKITHYPLSF